MLGAVFIRNAFKPESKEKVLSRFLIDSLQGWFPGLTIIREKKNFDQFKLKWASHNEK